MGKIKAFPVLSMRKFKNLMQFILKLFRNNLYFKNITSILTDPGIMCNSCKIEPEDRIHFFRCKIHNEIIQRLFQSFVTLKILKQIPKIEPFFYNVSLPINHPSNIIFFSTIKYMYNLRFLEIVPSIALVKTLVTKFTEKT